MEITVSSSLVQLSVAGSYVQIVNSAAAGAYRQIAVAVVLVVIPRMTTTVSGTQTRIYVQLATLLHFVTGGCAPLA